MGNDCFHFKKFTILHNHTAMRVGTDSVLLGAWCEINNKNRILDIGTGSALLAIMLAQRCKNAIITGVEIDEAATIQARNNVAHSPWSDRINIEHCDIRCYDTQEKFDLIISNPPFFEVNRNTIQNSRKIARQTLTLSHSDLLDCAARLLESKGLFAVIIPNSIADDFIFKAWEKGLRLVRRTDVRASANKPKKRSLLEFSNIRTDYLIKDVLILNDLNGNRTPEYENLTEEFYL